MMWWCSDLLETYWKPAAVGVKQSAPVHLVYFARISVDAAFRWDYTANGFTSLTDHMVAYFRVDSRVFRNINNPMKSLSRHGSSRDKKAKETIR